MTISPDLTCNAFLGGRLQIWQPANGFRSGIDAVLLAASVEARAGQTVLELGAGAGVASLCLGARVPGLAITALELQPDYAALAARNAAENGQSLVVVTGDLTAMPAAIKARRFDHVMANPPYFQRQRGSKAQDGGRDVALAGDTPLADWVSAAARRLQPNGRASFIQRAERLPDLLAAMSNLLGGITAQPLLPREGREAKLVIVQGRKEARGRFRLLSPVILHEGPVHTADGDDYSGPVSAVLRQGAALYSDPSA